eukprot:scaffold216094_cov32-Tisochrysis_lutea.AAC.1
MLRAAGVDIAEKGVELRKWAHAQHSYVGYMPQESRVGIKRFSDLERSQRGVRNKQRTSPRVQLDGEDRPVTGKRRALDSRAHSHEQHTASGVDALHQLVITSGCALPGIAPSAR